MENLSFLMAILICSVGIIGAVTAFVATSGNLREKRTWKHSYFETGIDADLATSNYYRSEAVANFFAGIIFVAIIIMMGFVGLAIEIGL